MYITECLKTAYMMQNIKIYYQWAGTVWQKLCFYLNKVIKPAGMNFQEPRNLSPITTQRVPAVPAFKEEQRFAKFGKLNSFKLFNTWTHSPAESHTFLGFLDVR